MKIYIFALLLISSKAFGLCAPAQIAKELNCEALDQPQISCQQDYGYGNSVKESGTCSSKNVTAALKKTVPSAILAYVKSSSDEVDAMLTMIDRKGMSNGLMDFKILEVKTFHESHINALFSKMSDLREQVYLLSISVDVVDSKVGKQAIIYAARYYSFIARIHQVMASAAHSANNADNKLDYDMLKKFSLKLDKRVSLEILARMNLKAKHLDGETIKFAVSEEEKQNFEFNVLQSPYSLPDYAKLVQFMSIREFLNNRWALKRISAKENDDPALSYCGPNMLSFKPGKNLKMSSSNVASELDSFDLYFTRFPAIVDSLVSASKKVSVLNPNKSISMVDKVFKGLPTFSQRMINEFGWTQDELSGWKQDIAATLKQNEDKEWELYAQSTLSVTVLPGDLLTPANLEDRIINDIFSLRKEAILSQMNSMMNDLTQIEKVKMQKIVGSFIEESRDSWELAMKPLIKTVVGGIDNLANFRYKNYLDKLAQTKEIATSALSAAYLQNEMKENNKKKEYRPKLNILDLEPKSPSELVEFFQSKFVKNQVVNYYVDKDADKREVVTQFFQKISTRFQKLTGIVNVRQLQVKLMQIANEEAVALRIKYPLPIITPKETQKKEDFRLQIQPMVADNTRVAKPVFNPYLKLTLDDNASADLNPKKTQTTKSKPVVLKPTTVMASDSVRTSYNALSMSRFQPMVADNTRVKINRIMPDFKSKNLPTAKTYNVHIDDLNALREMPNFVSAFLRMLNLNGSGKSTTLLAGLADQNIMADIRLAAAYNGASLLKIPLIRTHVEYGGTTYDGISLETEVKDEKPAMIRMLEAFKLNTDGTYTINDTKLVGIIQETINSAFANQKDKTKVVCLADYRNPSGDKNYKTLFRSSTFIRQGILSNEALTDGMAARLQRLDEQLKKETRYWHEAINEDWIEPMMNVACVIFIVSALIIPVLGSAGILAPGSIMLAMTMLDGVDLAITGASLYFRSVSTFYEIPAQVKFQKSLAYTQVENFALTSWDDVKSAEASSKMSKTLLLAFSPLDAMVGGQFYFSAKKLLGVTGKQALKRAGMQARGFGAPPKSMLKTLSLSEMIKKNGLVKGVGAKTVQELGNLKYWTPRYQPFTKREITESLRKGIVSKSRKLTMDIVNGGSISKALADEPWSLIGELKASVKRIDERLNVNKIVTNLGTEMDQVSQKGRMTWKEFLANPTYAKEFLVPKTLVIAAKNGKLLNYLENRGHVTNGMNRLRGQFLNKRKKAINILIEKLEDVKTMSAAHPEYLVDNGMANWMDHFQSLLSDQELKSIRDISKTSSGSMKEFKSVFADHEVILETIVTFSTVRGQTLGRAGTTYAKAIVNSGEKSDISEMYLDMLDNHSSDIGADDLLEMRREIEDDIL